MAIVRTMHALLLGQRMRCPYIGKIQFTESHFRASGTVLIFLRKTH